MSHLNVLELKVFRIIDSSYSLYNKFKKLSRNCWTNSLYLPAIPKAEQQKSDSS